MSKPPVICLQWPGAVQDSPKKPKHRFTWFDFIIDGPCHHDCSEIRSLGDRVRNKDTFSPRRRGSSPLPDVNDMTFHSQTRPVNGQNFHIGTLLMSVSIKPGLVPSSAHESLEFENRNISSSMDDNSLGDGFAILPATMTASRKI